MTGMMENVFLNVKNKSNTITAEIEVLADEDANGTIIAQGGRFGGWSMYLKNGVPGYEYNFLGLERTTIAGKTPLPLVRQRSSLSSPMTVVAQVKAE